MRALPQDNCLGPWAPVNGLQLELLSALRSSFDLFFDFNDNQGTGTLTPVDGSIVNNAYTFSGSALTVSGIPNAEWLNKTDIYYSVEFVFSISR